MQASISDEELLYLVQEKNDFALNLLIERYKVYLFTFINNVSSKWHYYQEIEDLFQIAWIKFLELLNLYNPKLGKFYPFVRTSITRAISDHFKINLKKQIDYSLDKQLSKDGDASFLDIMYEEYCEYGLSGVFNNQEKIKKIAAILKEEELNLLIDKTSGYSYKELAIKYNENTKKIDNKLHAIKRKIRKEFS